VEEWDLAVEEAGGGHGQCVSPAGTWNLLPCETAFPSRSIRRVGPTMSENIKWRVVEINLPCSAPTASFWVLSKH